MGFFGTSSTLPYAAILFARNALNYSYAGTLLRVLHSLHTCPSFVIVKLFLDFGSIDKTNAFVGLESPCSDLIDVTLVNFFKRAVASFWEEEEDPNEHDCIGRPKDVTLIIR